MKWIGSQEGHAFGNKRNLKSDAIRSKVWVEAKMI